MNLIKGNGCTCGAPVHVRKLCWIRPAVRAKLGPLPKIDGISPGFSEFVERRPVRVHPCVSGFSVVSVACILLLLIGCMYVVTRLVSSGAHLGFFTLVTFKPL